MKTHLVAILPLTALILLSGGCSQPETTGESPAASAPPQEAPAETPPAKTEASDRLVLTADNIYDHSIFWPPFVHAREGVTDPEGKRLHPRIRLVLVRLEDAGRTVVVDEGRRILRLPIEQTNFLEQAQAFADKKERREFPTLGVQLAPRLYNPRKEEGKTNPPLFQFLADYDYCLIAYIGEDGLKFVNTIPTIEKGLANLPERQAARTAVIMIDAVGIDNNLLLAFNKAPIEWWGVLPLWSKGYVHALDHQPGSDGLFALADINGKLLYRGTDLDALFKSYPNPSQIAGAIVTQQTPTP